MLCLKSLKEGNVGTVGSRNANTWGNSCEFCGREHDLAKLAFSESLVSQYLSKFLQHLSDITKPLRDLTRQDAEWIWDEP